MWVLTVYREAFQRDKERTSSGNNAGHTALTQSIPKKWSSNREGTFKVKGKNECPGRERGPLCSHQYKLHPSFHTTGTESRLWIVVDAASSRLKSWPGVCKRWGLGVESAKLEEVILPQDYSSWISWLLPFLLQGLSLWDLFSLSLCVTFDAETEKEREPRAWPKVS